MVRPTQPLDVQILRRHRILGSILLEMESVWIHNCKKHRKHRKYRSSYAIRGLFTEWIWWWGARNVPGTLRYHLFLSNSLVGTLVIIITETSRNQQKDLTGSLFLFSLRYVAVSLKAQRLLRASVG